MGAALERLKKAVSMKPVRRSVELPDGSEFEFWMTPTTLAERGRAQKNSPTDNATDFALQLLALKATDQDGQQLFGVADLPELRNSLPAVVVEALMVQLLATDESDEEVEDSPKSLSSSSRKTAS